MDDLWLACNDHTDQYIKANEERLREADKLLLNYESPDVRKNATFNQVRYDFGTRYKSGQVEDVDDFLKLLEEKGCDKLFLDCLIKKDELEMVRDRLDEYLQRQLRRHQA